MGVEAVVIAALDVQYNESASTAVAAAVVFANWQDVLPYSEYLVECQDIQGYVPGEFYKREMPCLMAVLAKVAEPLDLIVIDGYVSLGDKPGLGMYLWQAMKEKVPVVGVAKTPFHSAAAVAIVRGGSHSPLYVTAVGLDSVEAAQKVQRMAGEFRIPALLKRVDQLARGNNSP
jgi:deoxyribonuclease V